MTVRVIFVDLNPTYGITDNNIMIINRDAINRQIYNILSTLKGTRIFEPEFGSNIQAMIFEPKNQVSSSSIYAEVISALKRWQPRIKVNSASTYVTETEDGYLVHIDYTILANKSLGTYDLRVSRD